MSETAAQLVWAGVLSCGLAFCWVTRRYQLLPQWFLNSPALLLAPPVVGLVTSLLFAVEIYFSIESHRFFGAGVALVVMTTLLVSTPSRWRKAKFEWSVWHGRQSHLPPRKKPHPS